MGEGTGVGAVRAHTPHTSLGRDSRIPPESMRRPAFFRLLAPGGKEAKRG